MKSSLTSMNRLKHQYAFLPVMLIALLAVGCVPYQKDSEGEDGPSKPPPMTRDSESDPDGKDPKTTDDSANKPPVKQPSVETEEDRTARSLIAKLGGSQDEAVAATRVLEAMGPSATQYLVVALKDPSPAVRQRAAFMLLARFNPADAQMTAAVIRTLGDKSPDVRHMALRAVDQIEDPAIAQPAVKYLVKMLEQEEKALVRAHAARVLGRLGAHSKPGFSVLQKAMLKDQDRAVRFAALKTICQVGASDVETVEALAAVLKESTDANLRRQVILRLPGYGTAANTAIVPLVAILSEPNERLRATASDALGQLGLPAVGALIQSLGEKQPVARAMAALTLGKIGPEAADAVERLKQTLKDDQEVVRQAAKVALRQIQLNP